MNEEQIIKKAEEFSKFYSDQILARLKGWDEYRDHALEVRKYAIELAQIEQADKFVVEIAALLHDIGKVGGSENHALRSVELAKKFLSDFNIDEERVELILYAIKKHSFQYSREDNFIEVKVVQSADAMAVLFSDNIMENIIKNYDKNMARKLIQATFNKISLDSARELSKKRLEKLLNKVK